MDSGLLGLGGRCLSLARRLLGPPRRFLRRRELRLWLYRCWTGQGGYWHGGAFFYNRSVMSVGSVHVTNIYNRTVINNNFSNHVAFNGGPGGLGARPTHEEVVVL